MVSKPSGGVVCKRMYRVPFVVSENGLGLRDQRLAFHVAWVGRVLGVQESRPVFVPRMQS